jgi:hypothetical protein
MFLICLSLILKHKYPLNLQKPLPYEERAGEQDGLQQTILTTTTSMQSNDTNDNIYLQD